MDCLKCSPWAAMHGSSGLGTGVTATKGRAPLGNSPSVIGSPDREAWLEQEVIRLQRELEKHSPKSAAYLRGPSSSFAGYNATSGVTASKLRGDSTGSGWNLVGDNTADGAGGSLAVDDVTVALAGTNGKEGSRYTRGLSLADEAEPVAEIEHEEQAPRISANYSVFGLNNIVGLSAMVGSSVNSMVLYGSALTYRKPVRALIFLVALAGVVFVMVSQAMHLGAESHGDDVHGEDHSSTEHADPEHRLLYSAHASRGHGRRLGGDVSPTMLNIAFTLTSAGLIAFIANLLQLPLILGYILGGVLVGPIGLNIVDSHVEIQELSSLGLIFLLFMIGLELDVKELLKMGKVVLLTGALQFPICAGVQYVIIAGLSAIGISFGEGDYAGLYMGLVCGISSTMIVVKLLSEKSETDSPPGRLTIGILIFQDIWAIIVLAIQPKIASPEIGGLLVTFVMIVVLICIALAYAKFVMPAVLYYASKSVELMLVLSLAWCFFIGCIAIQPYIGLSMELAALIAGVALATFPYSAEFNGKIKYIRDFFITLFFAGLGMQIPVPEVVPILKAFLMAFIVLVVRWLGIFLVVFFLGGGARLAALSTINLSQVSEFALVICSLGIDFEHVSRDALTIVIWTFAILAISASYLIGYNHHIYRFLARLARKIRGMPQAEETTGPKERVVFSMTIQNLDFDEIAKLRVPVENAIKQAVASQAHNVSEKDISLEIVAQATSVQVETTITPQQPNAQVVADSIHMVSLGEAVRDGVNRVHNIERATLEEIAVDQITEPEVIKNDEEDEHEQDIVLLGFHRIAFMLVAEFQAKNPAMLKHLHVIDFNQGIMPALRRKGVKCTYGDISSPDVLHHCHHGEPKLVISTIPDSLLCGITNAKLLKIAKEVWPNANYIVTADNPMQAEQLYELAADYVLRSAKLCAERLEDLLSKHRASLSGKDSELANLFKHYRSRDKDKRTSFIQERLH